MAAISCYSNRIKLSRALSRDISTHVVEFNMADDNIEDGGTNELSSLALDSNKQKEFEDKVKRIRAQVSTELYAMRNSSVQIAIMCMLVCVMV